MTYEYVEPYSTYLYEAQRHMLPHGESQEHTTPEE